MKKILIVEDEPDVAAYLSTLLTDNGYLTITAEDGKQGYEKAASEKPDLITLDISMPKESGVRMYRDMQENPNAAHIPVVIVTGISDEFKRFINSRKQVRPPDAYFEKPIDKEKFLEVIKKLTNS